VRAYGRGFMRCRAIRLAMGLRDYLGALDEQAAFPIVNMPGCPVQPDNFMETLLYLLYQLAGRAHDPLDAEGRPTWLFQRHRDEGCDRAATTSRRICRGIRLAEVHREARLLGSVVQCNVRQTRLDGWHGRLPDVGDLHRLHHARFPDKFMPFMNEPPGAIMSSSAVGMYGVPCARSARFTRMSLNREPDWRAPGPELTLLRTHQLRK